MEKTCVFCQIAAGQAGASVVYKDDQITAFEDKHPVAPVHLLIIPNLHIDSAGEALPEHEALIGRMVRVAARLAAEHHIDGSGYRLVINTGPDAGQSVFHLHLHLIGGRQMPFRFD